MKRIVFALVVICSVDFALACGSRAVILDNKLSTALAYGCRADSHPSSAVKFVQPGQEKRCCGYKLWWSRSPVQFQGELDNQEEQNTCGRIFFMKKRVVVGMDHNSNLSVERTCEE